MMGNVQKQKFKRAENKESIKGDLRQLQIASDKEIFDNGWMLLKAKLAKKEAQFIKYFEANHITMNCNWHEGASDHTPSSNNCNETFNRLLKQDQTHYLRKPVNQFMISALEIVKERSTQYLRDKSPPTTVVTLSDELRLKAWDYSRSQKSMVFDKTNDGKLVVQ